MQANDALVKFVHDLPFGFRTYSCRALPIYTYIVDFLCQHAEPQCVVLHAPEEQRATNKSLATVYTDSRGRKRCTGDRGRLKSSQRLVCVLARLWRFFCRPLRHKLLYVCMLYTRLLLRQHPVGFGHAVAGLLPKMQDGVKGLRVFKVGPTFCAGAFPRL